MPKNKKTQTTSVSFHRGFAPPTAEERRAALGSFPGATHADQSRRDMLLRQPPADGDDERDDPEPKSSATPPVNLRRHPHRPSLERSNITAEDALADLNSRELYIPTARSVTSLAVPRPRDELDWLAQVPEEGQTFDEYVQFQTSTNGRIRPIANPDGEDIVLLPIVRADGAAQEGIVGGRWADCGGPPLDKLVAYTRAFFDRNVRVLPSATVGVAGIELESEFKSDSGGSKKRRRTHLAQPGAFASSGSKKGVFQIRFPRADGSMSPPTKIVGRADTRSKHVQLKADSVLDELASFRESQRQLVTLSGQRDFCIMGITMEDLYDGPKDLFCAGFAFGGSKVALFSFFRYHPNLKMHPLHWYNFGYSVKPSSYSYYDDNDQNPTGLTREPPPFDGTQGEEFLRRSSKLLTHELGHLYGLDHCVHNRCLMMGTGHLVEDFRAPSHLCGVCLRKLQWRLGFDVRGRYGVVADAFRDMGMTREQKWSERQLNALSVLRSH